MVNTKIVIRDRPLNNLGCSGVVFPVGNDLVVKIPKSKGVERKLIEEYNIQRELYSASVRVPEPKQIIDVFLEDDIFHESLFLNKNQKGILMQRLYGPSLEEVYYNQDEKFGDYIADCREQIAIASSLGFRSGDPGIHNTILNEKDSKVYLIDFGDWEKVRS